MTRYSKVFVPVSPLDAAKLDYDRMIKVFKAHKKGGYTSYGFAEEKENVYVLTEQELQQIIVDAVFEHKNTTIDKFMEKLTHKLKSHE